MDRIMLIRKLESEIREMRKDFEEGKCIPLEEFDWGLDRKTNHPIDIFVGNVL